MGQRVLSLIISDTPPVNAKGSLWIKYIRKTNSYQIMLPVPHGWIAAGPTNDYVNQIVDRMLAPYPDEGDGSGSGSTGGAFNSSFNQSYDASKGLNPRVEATANKVQSISAESTEKQYPSAKAVYEAIQSAVGDTSDFNDDFNDDFGGGSGSVDLSDVVKFTEQTPTTEQQDIARKNIGINQIVYVDQYDLPEQYLPGVIYDLGAPYNPIYFTWDNFAPSSNENEANHYYFRFNTVNDALTITWPSGLVWVNDEVPEFVSDKHYEISIMDGVGIWVESDIPNTEAPEEPAL